MSQYCKTALITPDKHTFNLVNGLVNKSIMLDEGNFNQHVNLDNFDLSDTNVQSESIEMVESNNYNYVFVESHRQSICEHILKLAIDEKLTACILDSRDESFSGFRLHIINNGVLVESISFEDNTFGSCVYTTEDHKTLGEVLLSKDVDTRVIELATEEFY